MRAFEKGACSQGNRVEIWGSIGEIAYHLKHVNIHIRTYLYFKTDTLDPRWGYDGFELKKLGLRYEDDNVLDS